MAPPRKALSKGNTSVWDEVEVLKILNKRHATKMWNWLAQHPHASKESIPFHEWSVGREAVKLLLDSFITSTSKVLESYESNRGDTTKLLVELHDGHRVETVVMKHDKRSTVCVSSQVGCQMGCRFCATGTLGIIGECLIYHFSFNNALLAVTLRQFFCCSVLLYYKLLLVEVRRIIKLLY